MINDFYEYFLFVVINILDIGMVYYLVHNITTPKNKWLSIQDQNKRPPLTLKVVAIGILHGMIVGYFAYLFTAEILFRFIGIVLFWLIIKLMTKEKWGNVIIVFVIAFLSLSTIQAFLVIPMNLLEIPTVYMTLIAQLLGFITCFVFCRMASLYKLFVFIKNKLLWMHFVILIPFIVLMSVAMSYFFSISNDIFVLLSFLIISLTVITGSYLTIEYAKKLSMKSHHVDSLLEGLNYLVKTVDDPLEIQKHYDDTLKRMEFEIPESNFQPDNDEANLIQFIDNKKVTKQAKMQIIKNVKFYWKNRNVSLPIIVYMLDTLLNNAFDTKIKKPLFVDVTVAAHAIEITVSNASDKKSPIEIRQMFDSGASSKKGNRGYGLPNLSKIVKSYNGDIAVSCDYKPEYKSYYLVMTIRIKEFN